MELLIKASFNITTGKLEVKVINEDTKELVKTHNIEYRKSSLNKLVNNYANKGNEIYNVECIEFNMG